MIQREVIAGDTFPIIYRHRQNGQIADLPVGYDYMIGLHKENGENITTFSYQNGDIERTELGTYVWKISHDLSKQLKGTVVVEMVVYSADLSYVHHCNEPIQLKVIPSFMNEKIADNTNND